MWGKNWTRRGGCAALSTRTKGGPDHGRNWLLSVERGTWTAVVGKRGASGGRGWLWFGAHLGPLPPMDRSSGSKYVRLVCDRWYSRHHKAAHHDRCVLHLDLYPSR